MAKQRGTNNGGNNNGGNTGGNNGGAGNGGAGGEDDDDDEIDPRIADMINTTVSAAVSAHVNRKLKPIADKIGQLDDIGSKLDALLAGGKGEGGGEGNNPAKGNEGGGTGGGKAAPDPEKLALQKRLDALENERKAEREGARNAKRDAKLTELATAAGVDKLRVRGAVAILRDQVKFGDDGEPVMTVQRKGYTEDVDLDTGVAEFFGTDEGKAYLAPQGRGGGGGGGGNANTGTRTSSSSVVRGGNANAGSGNRTGNASAKGAETAKAERKAQALDNLQGAVNELLAGGNIEIG